MTHLPIDLAFTLALAGIPSNLPEDELERTLRSAIADRGGYLGDCHVGETGWELELLAPVVDVFTGGTRVLAHAWCLVFLMGERGEIGAKGFAG